MKKLLPVLLIFTLLLSACAGTGSGRTGSTTARPETTASAGSETTAAPPEKTAAVSDYFPFTADVHMKYKGTGNEYAAYDTYVDYVRDNKIQIRKNDGGTEVVTVYAIKDGALVSDFERGETYYKYDFTSMTDGEDILLKEPLKEGNSWKAKDGSQRSITSVDKQIDTPSGSYPSIEVTTKASDSIIRDYYAKGVGLVKTEFSSGDGAMTVVSELEKVEKDVPFKHSVRFFFPQFEKDRTVYIVREVSVKTNEDMKFKFQKELKTIPSEGGLTKTLTKNTQVLGVKLDDGKDTVTVNLSGDFIKEMNAGTTLEGMLLDSIANTFGSYYMKSKVVITIDGKLYESGHILLEKGQSFPVKTDGITEFKE